MEPGMTEQEPENQMKGLELLAWAFFPTSLFEEAEQIVNSSTVIPEVKPYVCTLLASLEIVKLCAYTCGVYNTVSNLFQ